MQHNIEKDLGFNEVINYLYSFDFPYKDIMAEQFKAATISKEETESQLIYHVYVNAFSPRFPKCFSGIPISIQINSAGSINVLEVFVSHGFIAECRIYNINNTKLEISALRTGNASMDIIYNVNQIKELIEEKEVNVCNVSVRQIKGEINMAISFLIDDVRHTIYLENCTVVRLNLNNGRSVCNFKLTIPIKEDDPYAIKTKEDIFDVYCRRITQRDRLQY